MSKAQLEGRLVERSAGSAQWLIIGLMLGCDDNSDTTSGSEPVLAPMFNVDIRGSLVVTEELALRGFSLQRVMDQLATQAAVPGLTGISMFRQWWDTQNQSPGLSQGPHCNDQSHMAYGTTINGFPYDCRPAPSEGAHASCSSFSDPACEYIPIGLFNRFDLAAVDGSHCGEYRIVYAKKTGQADPNDRNLLIFEANVRNPRPQEQLAGCLPLVQQWANLTQQRELRARAMLLEQIYFVGTSYLGPVIDTRNFGDNPLGLGQIRTNQFMGQSITRIWSLREFKLMRACAQAGCLLQAVPVTTKVNPFGPLFDVTNVDARAAQFQASLLTEVAALGATDVADIAMQTTDAYNSPQSHASGSNEMRYPLHFGTGPSTFRTDIEAALASAGSGLTADHIVQRALSQSCAGCHQLSNGADLGAGKSWPRSLGFVHVTERDPETVSGIVRFRISAALTDVFLPVRKQVMDDYLNGRALPRRGRGTSIGGRETH